jgi:DNA polymerase III gamma/tau subunit
MLPIILVSQNAKSQEKFIEEFILKNQILSYYVYFIEPVKDEVTIDQVRLIKKEIIMSIKNKRLFVIRDFDNASSEVQNAMLKTLEENNEINLFILLVTNIAKILPTIRSRSNTLVLDKKLSIKNPKFTELLEKTQNHDITVARLLSDKSVDGMTKEEGLKFFDELILYFRQKLRKGNLAEIKILKKAMDLKSLLQNNNLNPQLTIDNMLIFIKKAYTIK